MLSANLHRDFSPLNVCGKLLIRLSCKQNMVQPAEIPPSHPPQSTHALTLSTTYSTEDEDPVEENIFLSTVDPTSLTQEKSLPRDIMCRGFYARGTDLIMDMRITDTDNPTNKVQSVEKSFTSMSTGIRTRTCANTSTKDDTLCCM